MVFITPGHFRQDKVVDQRKSRVSWPPVIAQTFFLSYCAVLCGRPHLSGTSRGIKQMLFDTDMSFTKLRCFCFSPAVTPRDTEETYQIITWTFMYRSVSALRVRGVQYGVLQGPKGARCLPDGPVSQPTEGSSGPFISSRLGCFQSR